MYRLLGAKRLYERYTRVHYSQESSAEFESTFQSSKYFSLANIVAKTTYPFSQNIGAESSDRLLSMHTEDYKYEATLSVIHVQLVESDTHFRMLKLENRIFRLNDACPMRQSLSSQLKTHFCTKHAFFVTEKRILQDFLTLNLGGTFRSWSGTDAIHRAVLVDALRGTAHGQEETVRHLA